MKTVKLLQRIQLISANSTMTMNIGKYFEVIQNHNFRVVLNYHGNLRQTTLLKFMKQALDDLKSYA